MDCYAVLDVLPTASTTTIRATYRRLAQEWHPDKHLGAKAEATRRMSDINLAWEILKSPETRRLYDEARATGTQWVPVGRDGDGIRRATRIHADAPIMLEVDSGCVHSVGHDGRNKLFIEFRSGGLYAYDDVPPTLYRDLLREKYKGRFVIFNIVSGPYQCKRIGG
ncbi:MAG: DnaJ domain-containing protein [Fimbriimonadaceae bacterium]